jgi:hypothetical protein
VALTHGALDVKSTDVLPALLQKRDKEVDGKEQVSTELLVGHVDVSDGNTHAQDLLQLELDGRLKLLNLGLDIITVRDGGGEHTHLVKLGTKETRDLTDQRVRGNEAIVLVGYTGGKRRRRVSHSNFWFGEQARNESHQLVPSLEKNSHTPLLDELLVLVELLEVITRGGIDSETLNLVEMLGISDNAELHVGAGNIGELVRTSKTLITLGVVVLKTNLELDGLQEVSLLGLASLEDILDGCVKGFLADLTIIFPIILVNN